ncbi:hypothetical protein ACX8XP_11940 [Calditrichota bacterium LG25]
MELKKKSKMVNIFIILIILIYFFFNNKKYGKGNYIFEIKNTKNLLAFTKETPSENIFERNKNDIYLLNVKSGKIFQLTDDPYQYAYISWSIKGDRLIFTSTRNKEKAARFDESKNLDYIVIYNFKTHKEKILEDNIAKEVETLKQTLRQKNTDIVIGERKYCDSSNPFWINENRIGFLRVIPIGLGYGYEVLCSADTNGNKLKVFRDFSKFPSYELTSPQWINEDSVIVQITDPNFVESKFSHIALFLTKLKKYIILSDTSYRASSPQLFENREKVLYFIIKNDKIIRVILDIKSMKKVFFDASDIGRAPTLSPKGNKIAYLKGKDLFEGDIYIKDLNTLKEERMTFDGGIKDLWSWSPNSDD